MLEPTKHNTYDYKVNAKCMSQNSQRTLKELSLCCCLLNITQSTYCENVSLRFSYPKQCCKLRLCECCLISVGYMLMLTKIMHCFKNVIVTD